MRFKNIFRGLRNSRDEIVKQTSSLIIEDEETQQQQQQQQHQPLIDLSDPIIDEKRFQNFHFEHHNHETKNYQLFIRDLYSNESFLINGNSNISIYPKDTVKHYSLQRNDSKKKQKKKKRKRKYDSDDEQIMNKYTEKCLITLDLGFDHEFIFEFILDETKYPIIGADFLAYYHLLPDYRCLQLLDFDYHRKVNCQTFPSSTTNDKHNTNLRIVNM
ncbi:uncharacterized protein LOC142645038 [Dermatophagoides pteronyssinus]|uniref:Uncharacterized protein n=1 Tax=Dermatophagoides pteronyssinus TaxID=6956 RepID=A0ABQ8JT83_DERPT|nr:hypothetical protein DERP_005043 [Dermatophagoides pteronyssinus]